LLIHTQPLGKVQNVQAVQSMNATKLSKQPYTTKSTAAHTAILHYSKLKLNVISHRVMC